MFNECFVGTVCDADHDLNQEWFCRSLIIYLTFNNKLELKKFVQVIKFSDLPVLDWCILLTACGEKYECGYYCICNAC